MACHSCGASLALLESTLGRSCQAWVTATAAAPCTTMAALSMLSEWPPPPPTRYASSSLSPSTSMGIATESLVGECGASDLDKGTHWPPDFRAYTMPFWLP
eukprot:scaffold3046_cov53-Phaeocystis_antarctica.AAC.2